MTENCMIDRRRTIALLAVGIAGLTGRLQGSETAEAAKPGKDKNRKSGKDKGSDKDKSSKKKTQSSGNGGSGNDVVKEAQKYKGAKYVWGGASPKGFDCSGFTWYVYDKAIGIDISRSVTEQFKVGKSVKNGSWKAGDIVFFKNTAEKGISHCGIYISGNKFIHAENEKTGVVISILDSGYYKDHYAGARRIL